MTYYSNYSIQDCIGLLSRKNIYDVFDYTFKMETEVSGEITFNHCNKHLWNGNKSVYMIEFTESKNTIIHIEFICENFFLPFSTIPQSWITEFMRQKLEAVNNAEMVDIPYASKTVG